MTYMKYESVVEETIISLLISQKYELIDESYLWIQDRKLDEFINKDLLFACLKRINHTNDENIIVDAINTITRLENPSLFERNLTFHNYFHQSIKI